jgi:outer membrane receptor for ferrienterochelin and colicins
MIRFIIVFVLGLITAIGVYAQQTEVNGKVVSGDNVMPYVNIIVKGTNIGIATNEQGFYKLSNIPAGRYVIQAQAIGFKSEMREIVVENGVTQSLDFNLEPDVMHLDQVVVTASRDELNRKDAPVIVSTMNAQQLGAIQAVTLSEGLNYISGLRTENNCQNCGFTQLRMNGMEGAYSQVLINGRPIFSGLAGVYGLEILPSGMIDRLEVIRGGGSALYGSNAIAGTVNVITKDPVRNTYAIKLSQQVVGVGIDGVSPSNDFLVNFNNSLIGNNARNGMALYGFLRKRNPFDSNGDEFSEIPLMNNLTIGAKFYQRIGLKSKITADVYAINSESRGGNKFDMPLHETDISEAVQHEIYSGALTFERFFRDEDMFSAYLSGQYIDRDAYYGAEKALDAYGNTKDLTWIGGVQYNARFDKLNAVFGLENQNGTLKDEKKAYREWDENIADYVYYSNALVANQSTNTSGLFTQADYRLGAIKLSAGFRYDHYMIQDLSNTEKPEVSGDVLSPRINLLYDIAEHIQARLSYSKGYRAPQVFDEDLHIETSGARQVFHENADDLTQETSHSSVFSIDMHPHLGENHLQATVEAFYTRLMDPFANEFGIPDENGKVIYTRVNAEGYAEVMGANLILNYIFSDKVNIGSGFTLQRSRYSTVQEFNEKRFFRTPDNYGYLTAQFIPANRFRITLTETYTGKMLIPYFGNTITDMEAGELRTSDIFFDTGLKLCYEIAHDKLNFNVFAGVKNIFNSYQSDFDIGIDRDPAYIYGPLLPRTFYFGVKIGDFR